MHQYFDSNYSGTHLQCNFYQNYQDFESKLSLIDAQGNDLLGNWIKANHMKVFLGEFGAADAGTNNTLKDFNNCRKDVGYMLQYTQEHAYNAAKPDQGGFIGWTAWRANKHGFTGFGAFNYLQQENDYVYGGDGTPRYTEGLGIAPGQGNSLMTDIFSQYLKPAASN
jgi:hypothetical protein